MHTYSTNSAHRRAQSLTSSAMNPNKALTIVNKTYVSCLMCFVLLVQAVIPIGFMPSKTSWVRLCPSQALYSLIDSTEDHQHHDHRESQFKAKNHCDWSASILDGLVIQMPAFIIQKHSITQEYSLLFSQLSLTKTHFQPIRAPPSFG